MPIDFGNILIQKITSISLPTSLDNEEEKLDPEQSHILETRNDDEIDFEDNFGILDIQYQNRENSLKRCPTKGLNVCNKKIKHL